MTRNTYAINVTRGKEFEVEDALKDLCLQPWVPRRLFCKKVKEKRKKGGMVWFDMPYVHKLIFCVVPAVYWPDVVKIKHVIGLPVELTERDIEGVPAHYKKFNGEYCPAVPGLKQFKEAVESEYADAQRLMANNQYQCKFKPGEALELLEGALAGHGAVFQKVIRRAYDDYPRLRVEAELFGRKTVIDISPDAARAVG